MIADKYGSKSIAAYLHISGFIRCQGLIGGKWSDAYDRKTIKVSNPATDEVIQMYHAWVGRKQMMQLLLHLFVVVNIVLGNAADIGEALLASPQVTKITFTVSTAVGKKLMAGAAGTMKKVSLELSGNAPCIIFDDADLEVALKGILATKFHNSGQICVCANRVLVQEGIYEKFCKCLF